MIAAVSRKDWPPQWAVGMIGVVLGAVLGAGLALLSTLFIHIIIKRRIENAIYRELLNGYWEALLMGQRLMSRSNTQEVIQEEATARIGFDAYQYAKTKPDVFYDLTFVAEIEEVYRFFQKIVEPTPNIFALLQRINVCTNLLEEKIAARRFDLKALRVACPPLVRDRVEELLSGKREPGSNP